MTASEISSSDVQDDKKRGSSASDSYKDNGGGHSSSRDSYGAQGDRFEKPKNAAMEVSVENNIEKAMKVLKRKLIKEGLFKELKSRRYYEKPSERKKRKHKESLKKVRKDEMRQKRNALLFS